MSPISNSFHRLAFMQHNLNDNELGGSAANKSSILKLECESLACN